MRKWEQLQSTLNNSKSKERQDDCQDNTQICSRQRKFELWNVNFYRFCSRGTSRIWNVWSFFKKGF